MSPTNYDNLHRIAVEFEEKIAVAPRQKQLCLAANENPTVKLTSAPSYNSKPKEKNHTKPKIKRRTKARHYDMESRLVFVFVLLVLLSRLSSLSVSFSVCFPVPFSRVLMPCSLFTATSARRSCVRPAFVVVVAVRKDSLLDTSFAFVLFCFVSFNCVRSCLVL